MVCFQQGTGRQLNRLAEKDSLEAVFKAVIAGTKVEYRAGQFSRPTSPTALGLSVDGFIELGGLTARHSCALRSPLFQRNVCACRRHCEGCWLVRGFPSVTRRKEVRGLS